MPPWERYQQSAAPSADPVIARDPYKTEDQQIKRDTAARAKRDQEIQEETLRIAQAKQAQGDADRAAGVDASEGERNNKAYYEKAIRALQAYDNTGVGPRTYAGAGIAALPGGEGALRMLPDAVGDSPDRQISEQAKKDFAQAVLRSDSGANAPEPEVARMVGILFPGPGETDPAVIANYAAARQEALTAMRAKAGRLSNGLEEYVPPPPPSAEGGEDAYSQDEDGAFSLKGTVTDEGAPLPPAGPDGDPRFDRDPSGLSGLGSLAKQGVTLGLSDEAAGIGGFLSSAITGEDPVKAYRRERDTERNFIAKARSEWPVIGTGAEFLAGGGAARIASVPSALGTIVRQGAGLGALGGFGYGEGTSSVASAGVGALGGGALGYGLGRLSGALANRAVSNAPDMEVVAAGQRRDVPVRGPDARPEQRLRRSELRTSSSAGQKIRDAEVEDIAAIEGAVDRDLGGAAANRSQAGDAAQEGVQAARKGMKDRASRHYERAHALSGRARVTPTNAIEAIDRNISELQEAGSKSNSSLIKYLNDVREDLSRDGGLTIEALRNQRTNMRGQINERNLSVTDAERRMGQVLDAAADDMSAGLAGRPEALKEFAAGDQIWRDRARFTKQIADRLLGPRDNPLSPDITATRLENWASSDFRRFRDMWTRLDGGAQADIRSHIAGNLGRNQRGDFSLEFFLKHTGGGKGGTVSDRTARLIFGDEGMSAIRDLRTLAQAKVNAGSATNRSETATAMQRGMNGLRHIVLTGLGFAAGDFSGAVAAPVAGVLLKQLGEQRATRLLLNPDFTKWLRQMPNSANPRVIDRYFSRLAGMGSVAANDNQAFTNALVTMVRNSPGRAAAEDEPDARRVPPEQ